MDAKTIGLIFVAILVAYFIMSPYQNCKRELGAAYCSVNTSWQGWIKLQMEFVNDFARGFGPVDSDVIFGLGIWVFVIWLIMRKYK